MSLWNRLAEALGMRQDPGTRLYTLSEPLQNGLRSLAERQGCSPQELAADLLSDGLARRSSAEDLWQRWRSLSPRQQDVAALACLGYTNRQIAARLGISPETVKTHLQNALARFALHGRSELRLRLAEWDFSGWEG
jgi:DNA-binding CsgD family transcriptional regulator